MLIFFTTWLHIHIYVHILWTNCCFKHVLLLFATWYYVFYTCYCFAFCFSCEYNSTMTRSLPRKSEKSVKAGNERPAILPRLGGPSWGGSPRGTPRWIFQPLRASRECISPPQQGGAMGLGPWALGQPPKVQAHEGTLVGSPWSSPMEAHGTPSSGAGGRPPHGPPIP